MNVISRHAMTRNQNLRLPLLRQSVTRRIAGSE